MTRSPGEFLENDSMRVRGIQPIDLRLPEGREGRVDHGSQTSALKLRGQIFGGVVGETKISRDELLVQKWRAEEAGHLLFFNGVARCGQDVADAGEDKAGDVTFEGLEKGELAVFECDDDVRLTNFDTVFGGNGENLLRIDAKSVEGGEQFPGRGIGRKREGWPKTRKQEKQDPGWHEGSVVTFGMTGQGGGQG